MILTFLLFAALSATPHGIGQWKQELGNHRAVVMVDSPTDVVSARLEWRRRDDPTSKQIIVTTEKGEVVSNEIARNLTRVVGDVAFQPTAGPGKYYIYFMPFKQTGSPYFPTVTYPTPTESADPAWLERSHLVVGKGEIEPLLEQARVLEFQDRGSFQSFDPMELIAGQQETDAYLKAHPKSNYIVFPEDRAHPIKMTDDLPERWMRQSGATKFSGQAKRGEFFTFQLGAWAARTPLKNLRVQFSDLRGKGGTRIPASSFSCINTGGNDWLGRPFTKVVDVPQGKIAPLWCGLQVANNAKPGEYRGTVTLRATGQATQTIPIRINVLAEVAKNFGDDNAADMTRLRWLDSKIGLDDKVVAPYTPLKAMGNTIQCLGREVKFGANGLPTSIRSGSTEILQAPIRFEALGQEGTWKSTKAKTLLHAPGAITQQTDSSAGSLEMRCTSKMESDGYINFKLAVTAKKAASFTDLRLEVPIRKDVAAYLMGMGKEGGYRPPIWNWDWEAGYANNMIWIGNINAGLQVKLKDVEDAWDLFKLSHVPDAWNNGGKGGCAISEEGQETVNLNAFSGPRTMAAGQTLHFNFGLLITPVKPLDSAHWGWRYDHEFISPEKAKSNGASIINVHQGNALNPNINYPFVEAPKLKAYVQRAHALGLKVKIYYTVRELSNRVVEIWALRSLGDEIYTDGPGGGDSWLQEHLITHYKPAWHTPLDDGEVDAAITTVGLSRWHNYYLEGLRWMVENVGIDGLYLDGIGYDREIMKRVRKVMDRAKPGCLIDFHCGNSYQPQYGMNSPANEFMEHFPYMSSLWLGEGYDYNRSPDYWLIEVSGIPFGMYGEMLQDNGNPWRGMLYGMTARYYGGADPKHIWKLWDDFGIAGAKMLGYWSPNCPVHTDNPNVLATAYVRKGRTLISIASWDKSPAQVHLQIDWKALGLDPARVTIVAPAVSGFQPEALFKPEDAISVEPGRGWLLEVTAAVSRR